MCWMALFGLQNVIADVTQEKVQEMTEKAPMYLNSAIEVMTEDIRNMVESIVASYTNQGMNIEIPTLNCEEIDIDEINLDDVINNISSTIEVQSNNWVKWALMGAGAVFGLIGMGIGYLAGRIFGEEKLSEEEKREKAMSKLLNQDERQKIFDGIAEKWNEIVQSIYDSIDESITENEHMKISVRNTVANLLGSYEENLRKARVLID